MAKEDQSLHLSIAAKDPCTSRFLIIDDATEALTFWSKV
jgi:hypothetical protein